MYEILGIAVFASFFIYGVVGLTIDHLTHGRTLSQNALVKTRKAEVIVKHGEAPSPF